MGEEDLRGEGLRIFTTLDPQVQLAAEKAVAGQIEQIERQHVRQRGHLQAAAVVTEPQTGEVIAIVGARNSESSGFNRALDARRPVGSLLKPAIYLSALRHPAQYAVNTVLDDEPITVTLDGKDWTPGNYDGISHGPTLLADALAHSYNLATVHLGMSVGLNEVIEVLNALGIEQKLPAYPSLLLGAADLSPMDITAMYQTLAAGGFRTPLRAIREILTRDGKPLKRYELNTIAAIDPRPVFLVNYLLTQATSTGTGASLSNWLGPETRVAGKTGTTNDLRDSWFAGFGGDRGAVVWVGRDDNEPIYLTGAQGALRIWGELMADVKLAPLPLTAPEGIEWRWVDRDSGAITSGGCSRSIAQPFMSPAPVAGTLGCPSPSDIQSFAR